MNEGDISLARVSPSCFRVSLSETEFDCFIVYFIVNWDC